MDVLCPRKSYSSAAEAQKILETEVVSSKQTILLGMSVSGFQNFLKLTLYAIVCHDFTNFEIVILRGHSITMWTLRGGRGKEVKIVYIISISVGGGQ